MMRARRILSLLLTVAMLVTVLSVTVSAENSTFNVGTQQELYDAIAAINAAESGQFSIYLTEDISAAGTSGRDNPLNIRRNTVTIYGEGHTLTVTAHSIYAADSAVLNLGAEGYDKSLKLTSSDDVSVVLAILDTATVNMYDNVTICDSISPSQAAGVQAEDHAAFNMYGGTIDNCVNRYSTAGGLVITDYASMLLAGGTISNCRGCVGGAVVLDGAATMTMTGGSIENCVAEHYGGGAVLLINAPQIGPADESLNAHFEMTGGEIRNCSTAYHGGGVCLYGDDTTAVLTGGSITGCSAGRYGGGFARAYGTATINGTAIYNNTAQSAGDDVLCFHAEKGSVTIGQVVSGLTLDPCGDKIDGWYDDGTEELRWNAHDEDQTVYMEKVEPGTFTDDLALKAAHGEKTGDDPGALPVPVVPQLLMWLGGPVLNTDDHVAYIIGYEDNTVRPENSITRAEVATIFFRLLSEDYRASIWSSTNDFSDVNAGDWYNNAVSTLANAKLLSGYPDGTFRPNAPITRAEFAAIVARFSSASAYNKASFTDVATTHWAAESIALAEQLGWVSGYPDGSFKPEKAITRAEAVTLINRVLGRSTTDGRMLPGMLTFRDNSPGAWYYAAIQEAANSHSYTYLHGQLTGSGSESWSSLIKNPDWAALEKTWAAAAK